MLRRSELGLSLPLPLFPFQFRCCCLFSPLRCFVLSVFSFPFPFVPFFSVLPSSLSTPLHSSPLISPLPSPFFLSSLLPFFPFASSWKCHDPRAFSRACLPPSPPPFRSQLMAVCICMSTLRRWLYLYYRRDFDIFIGRGRKGGVAGREGRAGRGG